MTVNYISHIIEIDFRFTIEYSSHAQKFLEKNLAILSRFQQTNNKIILRTPTKSDTSLNINVHFKSFLFGLKFE